MHIYNTMTRRKEKLDPIENNHLKMYTCGPTVYNFAHIGNFRAYTFEDLIRRAAQFNGMRVTQVMNLTDVDDKTIRGAMEAGSSLQEFTKPYIQAFFDDLKLLNIEPAEFYPAATDHIPEMLELIEQLFQRGLAYQSDDGSIYFNVAKYPAYGKLAHLDRDHLRAGDRVAHDEYDKENYGDFALWKSWDKRDGDVVWDSPWGKGRPGWHIECSAMSIKYLGASFDLHTGGIDNLFPHHENEIAQTEGATGKPFSKYWMHCAHLRVNGEKMSKSLDNFYTLQDLQAKGWQGREIRYVLINGHYRQPLNFTFEALAAARTSLARLDECIDALKERAGGATATTPPQWVTAIMDDFTTAVNNDLSLPEAFAALFALVRGSNSALHQAEALAPALAASLLEQFKRMDIVLGLVFFKSRSNANVLPPAITALLEQRGAARADKNWAEADRLRDEIMALGWEVRDSSEGQKVKRK